MSVEKGFTKENLDYYLKELASSGNRQFQDRWLKLEMSLSHLYYMQKKRKKMANDNHLFSVTY